MAEQRPTPNADDQRTDLQAMIAAGRELGPDMDASLVDSYMSRHAPRERNQQGAADGSPRSVVPWGGAGMRYIAFGVLGAGLVLAAVASFFWPGAQGGHSFWLPWFLFPWLFFVFFARRGMYRSRRTYTYTADDGRRVTVYERTRGYGRGYGPGYGSGNRYEQDPGRGYGPDERYDPPDPYGRPPAPRRDMPEGDSRYGADYRTDYRTEYPSDRREPPDPVV